MTHRRDRTHTWAGHATEYGTAEAFGKAFGESYRAGVPGKTNRPPREGRPVDVRMLNRDGDQSDAVLIFSAASA